MHPQQHEGRQGTRTASGNRQLHGDVSFMLHFMILQVGSDNAATGIDNGLRAIYSLPWQSNVVACYDYFLLWGLFFDLLDEAVNKLHGGTVSHGLYIEQLCCVF
jgi:hypothetical protein